MYIPLRVACVNGRRCPRPWETSPATPFQANMRVKIRGADDFLDVGQPVDYDKLMTQVTSTDLFLHERTLSPAELR